jgi:hypothetical protein
VIWRKIDGAVTVGCQSCVATGEECNFPELPWGVAKWPSLTRGTARLARRLKEVKGKRRPKVVKGKHRAKAPEVKRKAASPGTTPKSKTAPPVGVGGEGPSRSGAAFMRDVLVPSRPDLVAKAAASYDRTRAPSSVVSTPTPVEQAPAPPPAEHAPTPPQVRPDSPARGDFHTVFLPVLEPHATGGLDSGTADRSVQAMTLRAMCRREYEDVMGLAEVVDGRRRLAQAHLLDLIGGPGAPREGEEADGQGESSAAAVRREQERVAGITRREIEQGEWCLFEDEE